MNHAAVDFSANKKKQRQATFSTQPSVLADIYKEQINLAVWQNSLTDEVMQDIEALMGDITHLKAVITVTPDNIINLLAEHSNTLKDKHAFCQYVATLVDMFCTLFELEHAGLRLNLLDNAMCPKFHVDRVPCRLITTFSGIATEWLPHNQIDRSKLGAGSKGKPDEQSGIMQGEIEIQHLSTGDVGLLKGEGWYNNENAGLVHRSPALNNNERRLLLTLDFIN